MFKVIPVIDLYNGVVVHAKHGQRAHYHPIESQLTPSSQPIDIIHALLAVYPFEQLYIADLNAIIHADYLHQSLLQTIRDTFPTLDIWLDQGIRSKSHLDAHQTDRFTPVIGTENIATLADYSAIKMAHNNICLSLDFLADGYQGPSTLKEDAALWPNHVIIMTLANVGSNQGVNARLLKAYLTKRTTQQLYAAGGVRNVEDLRLLKQIGINGVLVASALHHKQITAKEISLIQQ